MTMTTDLFGEVPSPLPGQPWRDDEMETLRIILSEENCESSTTIARRYNQWFPGRDFHAVRSAVVHERKRREE